MGLRLYNTLTRAIEPFEPLRGPAVTVYACGPTVWNFAHIGNFRTFLLVDLLRRYLAYSGYEVFLVMNLTDVDDRVIKAAAQAGTTITRHTERFVAAFFEDRDYLRIQPADVYPRATGYVGPMISLVERLLERDLAYKGEDGSVYYAVGRFPRYGRLSRVDVGQLRDGARVSSDDYSKENVRDFALWKVAHGADEEAGAAWDSPFGRGRPGWHLECSVMALEEVGKRFGVGTVDIHVGGVDLIFPHHENEIAQSEGATGAQFARYWVHGEFLTVRGTKMSKRYGNILTVRDLREEGVDPATVRMLMFQTHYRQELNFSDEGLEGARSGVERLGDFRERLAAAAGTGKVGEAGGLGEGLAEADRLRSGFREALDDDLGAPAALGVLFTFVREANRALDEGRWGAREAREALRAFDSVVGVLDVLPSEGALDAELTGWVEEKIREREVARRAGEYARADAIREEVHRRGIELEDTPQGTRWKRRGG
ncbi:MAG: cysteine--tRNA ligase [Gemmatimonadales bacterium]